MTAREAIENTPKKHGEGVNSYCRRVSINNNKTLYSVRRAYFRMQKDGELDNVEAHDQYKNIVREISENEKEVICTATTIEQLIDVMDIDTEIWEVKEFRVETSTWDTSSKYRDQDLTWKENEKGEQIMKGHAIRKNEWITKNNKAYRIKARIVRKVSQGIEDILKITEERMRKYQPPVPKLNYPKVKARRASVINIFDAHIDKLALITETGEGSSLEKNINLFEQFFDELLLKELTNNPEIIYFPVGSDFFHTNDLTSNATKKGTPQDVLVKPIISFPMGFEVIRRCIDKTYVHCPVKVPVIRGNHDDDKTFYLGFALKIAYENNKNVEIDDSRMNRKYYKYGRSVLGFAHGNFEKRKIDEFPTRALMENKDIMPQIDHIDMFMGDIHHKQEHRFTRTKDFPGVTMRFLRSIGTTDKYHHDHGYLGIPKTAESFTYDYNKGLSGNSYVTIR